MFTGIRARGLSGLNKGRGSKFRVGSRLDKKKKKTEKGWWTYGDYIVIIAIKMQTMFRKLRMIKILKLRLRNSDNYFLNVFNS